MNIRIRLDRFYGERDLVVIVKCPDGRSTRGKYLVGMYLLDQQVVALVLDSELTFHPVIAKKYRLAALGGGHFLVDHDRGTIHISGRSETYGAEPDRQLTSAALEAALPKYRTIID